MSSITKDQLIFDATMIADSDSVGAFVRSSDGTLITHTTIGAKEHLDTTAALFDSAGNGITSTGGFLDVNIAAAPGLGVYAEDAAHTTGDLGQMALAVRNDTNSSLVDANGDYAPLQVDANGALKVSAEVTVQAGDAEFLEDTAHNSGDAGLHIMAVRQDTLSSLVDADGDYASFKVDSLGRLYTTSELSSSVADDAADAENPIKVGGRAIDVLAAVADNDRVDQAHDLFRRQYVNDSAHIGVQQAEIAITDASSNILGSPLAGRKRVLIQNVGDNEVYLGTTGVASTDGIFLRKRTSVELPLGENVTLAAVCAAGETTTLRVLEMA